MSTGRTSDQANAMTTGPPHETETPPPLPRGYGGVRITSPAPRKKQPSELDLSGNPVFPWTNRDERTRILTGAALLGVILTVLIHEFGHWLAGLTVTGKFPAFYGVAVRQREALSDGETVFVYIAGPALHLIALWALVIIGPRAGRFATRIIAGAGAALLVSLVLQVAIWALAVTTGVDDWNDDLPKVASVMGSHRWLWLHGLSASFLAGTVGAGYYWWKSMRRVPEKGLIRGPAIVGAFEGGIMLVLASFWVSVAIE